MPYTLFTGGAVFDGERHHPADRAPDVLAGAGRVVGVGHGLAVPDGTEVVDLAGGLLLPGFTDAHVHAVQGGLERLRCDLSGAADADDCLARVAGYAAANPDEEWVHGGGWAMAFFPGGTPTAADLDRVLPDRPALLVNRDHHGAWANSRALELAGIGPDTPDPAHGRIERDADGRPTGTLHEAAMGLVTRLLPEPGEEELDRALLEGQRYLLSLGVTSWQDAILGEYAGHPDLAPVYLRAAERGDLVAEVTGALWWDRDAGPEQVEGLVERRRRFSHGRLRALAVKVMLDGVAENFTAAMSAPYLDRCGHPTGNAGRSFVDAEAMRAAVAALVDADFQVHVHAIGDRAVRDALDAFEAAGTDRDLRHHVAHLQVVHPDDVPRFGRLGVTANMQALWACLDDQMVDLTLPFLGEERARWQYPFGDLWRAGAPLCAGSDWPVSTPDPLAALHTCVNRTDHEDPREPFLPEQALPAEVAFAAYTSGSARTVHRDDAGRLRPGHVADLAVLDRDPLAGEPAAIGDARVVSTWVGGVRLHHADD